MFVEDSSSRSYQSHILTDECSKDKGNNSDYRHTDKDKASSRVDMRNYRFSMTGDPAMESGERADHQSARERELITSVKISVDFG